VTRREHGSGSVYRRASDGRWMGTYEDGWTAAGTRRRRTVSAKTEAAAKRKLRDALAAKKRGERQDQSRATVKAWAETYLAIRVTELAPKAYNAAANPIKNWVVPTIGHKRLADLTPEDVRAVAAAQRKKGRKPNDTHRAMMTMLRWAAGEGHQVPASVLATKSPKAGQSDRQSMTVEEGLACIEVASHMPNGTRWLFTLLYGSRQAECLGLTWDAIDFDNAEARIEWQLQALPYNEHRNRASGFRLPDGYEARHLVDAYHLVRPKTRKGWRVAPLLPAVADALATWRTVAPDNAWGLVWPEPNGRPRNDKHDRSEWWQLQATAGVAHPSGRPYHVHETRSFAATMLFEAEVPEHVITDLLGHSSIVTSNRYRTVRREPMREAMEKVGRRLQLNGGDTP
jgi:integrase